MSEGAEDCDEEDEAAFAVGEGACVLLLAEDELLSLLKRSKNFWISGSTGSFGAAACADEAWFCTGVDGFSGDGDAQSQPIVTPCVLCTY